MDQEELTEMEKLTDSYLDDMVRTGLYGRDRHEVRVTLLLEGIRKAIKDGLIDLK
jgi:hypothetical protein